MYFFVFASFSSSLSRFNSFRCKIVATILSDANILTFHQINQNHRKIMMKWKSISYYTKWIKWCVWLALLIFTHLYFSRFPLCFQSIFKRKRKSDQKKLFQFNLHLFLSICSLRYGLISFRCFLWCFVMTCDRDLIKFDSIDIANAKQTLLLKRDSSFLDFIQTKADNRLENTEFIQP